MTTDDERDGERWDAAEEGAERLREGDLAGAVAELEAVLQGDPENPYALYFLGNAHYEAGRFEKALKGYVLALEMAPEHRGAMVGAGHALRMMGRHREALRMGKQLLQRDVNDADGLYLNGLIHYARGEGAAAKTYLERFLQTQPEVEVAQEVHGLLKILIGDIDEPEP